MSVYVKMYLFVCVGWEKNMSCNVKKVPPTPATSHWWSVVVVWSWDRKWEATDLCSTLSTLLLSSLIQLSIICPIHPPSSPAAVSDTPENPDLAELNLTPAPVSPRSGRQQNRHSCWHGNYFVILRQVLYHMHQGDRQNCPHLFFALFPSRIYL